MRFSAFGLFHFLLLNRSRLNWRCSVIFNDLLKFFCQLYKLFFTDSLVSVDSFEHEVRNFCVEVALLLQTNRESVSEFGDEQIGDLLSVF